MRSILFFGLMLISSCRVGPISGLYYSSGMDAQGKFSVTDSTFQLVVDGGLFYDSMAGHILRIRKGKWFLVRDMTRVRFTKSQNNNDQITTLRVYASGEPIVGYNVLLCGELLSTDGDGMINIPNLMCDTVVLPSLYGVTKRESITVQKGHNYDIRLNMNINRLGDTLKCSFSNRNRIAKIGSTKYILSESNE